MPVCTSIICPYQVVAKIPLYDFGSLFQSRWYHDEDRSRTLLFSFNIDTRYKRFTFGLNLSGNKNNVTAPAVAPSGEGGIMRYVSWFTRPTVPVMYSNGHYGYVDGSSLSAELMKESL